MASSLKYAVPVLDLCDDAQSKCLWKHVWMIYGKLIEKNLSMKKIGVVNESESSDPIAVGGPTNIVDKMHMHKCIRQTFIELIQEKNLQIKQLTNILIKVEELKTISSKFSEYEVAIYINKEVENSIWIVGPTIMIDAVVKCIEDKLHIFRVRINTNVKFDELKSLREKKEAHSIVDLSEKDQVICVFNNALKEDLFSVPSRYFSRDDAKQKLAKLEDNRKGTLSIKQDNDCATVQVSKTADAGFCPTQIEYLYKSKRVFFTKKQRKMAKMFLDKRKSFIENQFSVNIYEQDELFYEWIVKGEESMVEAAYKELLKIRHLPEQEKTYLIDDQIENIQLRLNTIAANSSCCVSLSSNTVILHELQTVAVDLREQIRCHRITIGGGFTVKLYKCSLPKNHWLGHNTLIMNVVHNAGDYTSKIKITANLNQSDRAALCLPIWKIYKEKDYLRKLMSEMKDYFKSAKLFPISIDLSEIEKVNWPVSQFLGTILLSFNFCEPTYCQFFVQSDDKFELSSDIINQWCQFKEGPMKKTLQINVVKSELAVMKCDVLVNNTNRELDLERGMVSKALLKAAGVELQRECDMTIKGRRIQSPEVVVTEGYNLSAKKVIHGVLPRYRSENNTQQYKSFIKNCLSTAVKLNMRSIAFPALGTGKLSYPPNVAASKMFLSVDEFASTNSIGSLTEVNFVIFPADTNVFQVFQAEANSRVKTATAGKTFDDSFVACPDFATYTVQVIGPTNELIKDTFQQIEEALKKNCKTNEELCTDRLVQIKASDINGSYIQYLQHLINATEDLSADLMDKRQNVVYSFHTRPADSSLWTNEKNMKSPPLMQRSPVLYGPQQDSITMTTKENNKVFVFKGMKTPPLMQVRSPVLYRPQQDSITMTTKENIKVFVYKADICYLSNVDCIVNPSNSDMKEIVGLTSIILGAGEDMKKECAQYIEEHGVLHEKRVCITTAGNLTHYKKILHVKAPAGNEYLPVDDISENLSATIRICLSQANRDNMTSIALPPLFTLGFDTDWNTKIVKTYPECVMEFSAVCGMKSSIKEIHFVDTNQAGVEAINMAFLHTNSLGNDNAYIERKVRATESIGYQNLNEFHNSKSYTKTLKSSDSHQSTDNAAKTKTYQSMPASFSETFPSNWTGMDGNEMIITVVLQPYDQEYKDVVDEFKQTSARHYDIIKVERIQNRTLHQQYIARKKLMDSINLSCFNNERKLWHGTTLEAVNGINTYGFNRSYCGKNAASYGNGVYFAVNSSYSTKSQYSTPDHDNNKRVYLCKVLVGEYVKGQRRMRVPPQKDGASGSHILYDSVVDNPSLPGIFVIFHDTQAYPQYLIVFR